MPVLYKFQRKGVRQIEHKFKGRALLADDMGLGKTIQALWWAKIFHKKWPIVVICPAFLKWNWKKEIDRHLGVSCIILEGRTPSKIPKGRIILVNYDILWDWVEEILMKEPTAVFVDECFPYATPVLTNIGYVPIGEIVEKELPVKVASFDVHKKCFEFRSVTQYIKIRRKTRLVTIYHNFGSLTCTEEHEIWTENKGYVKAINLEKDDQLRMVWDSHKQESVLQHILFSKMESETTLLEKGLSKSRARQKDKRSEERQEKTRCLGKDEEKQSDVSSTEHRDDAKGQGEKRYASNVEREERRQRTVHQTAEHTQEITRTEMDSGTVNTDEGETLRLPELLQGRHRKEEIQNRNRDRWQRTPTQQKEEGRGQEKTNPFRIARVEYIEIHERGSGQDTKENKEDHPFVYCLGVEKNHNFYANNILVHNCQYIKNRNAKRTKATKITVDSVRKKIFMSGTPIEKTPQEIWTVLNMLKPKKFPRFLPFAKRYCHYETTPWGLKFKGGKNLEELHELLLNTCMIRRRKADVLKDLPPKRRIIVPIRLSDWDMKKYNKAEQELIRWLILTKNKKGDTKRQAIRRSMMIQLKVLIGKLKAPIIKEWIQTFLDETKRKLIVCAVHRKLIADLEESFEDINVTVHGGITGKKRQEAVDRFMKRKSKRIFIGQIKAAGVGLNLQAASTVLFAELNWNPAEHTQFEDRAHRIGQTESVEVYYLIAEGTIEQKLCTMIQEKQKTVDAVLDGKSSKESLMIMDELEKALLKKRN